MNEGQRGSSNDRRGSNNRNNYSVEELLTTVIRANAERDQVKLRPYMIGKIVFEMTDSKKNYVFDWTADKLRVEKVAQSAKEENIDCTISTTETTITKIANGDINPQISMLSNYVNIKGKVSFAVYIFNLIIQ